MKKPEPSAKTADDRRQHPRVKLVTTPLTGRLTSGGENFVVEEASVSGFSMTSGATFVPGTAYRFRISSSQQHIAVVAAMCRSCTPVEREGAPLSYRAGFQFLPQPSRRLRLILGAIAMDAP
jgi:hypothetical protein